MAFGDSLHPNLIHCRRKAQLAEFCMDLGESRGEYDPALPRKP